jgi:VanZ family protein
MKQLIFFLKPYSKYLLIIWVVAISTVSSIPHLPSPKIGTGKGEIRLDYLIHFCEYGVLIFFSLLSFLDKNFNLSLKRYIVITIAAALFAAADEFHQKFIPGRTFNPKDIMSNLAGIFAGLMICFFFFRKIADEISGKSDSAP